MCEAEQSAHHLRNMCMCHAGRMEAQQIGSAGTAAAGGQRYWRTPSIARALAAPLPPSENLHGIRKQGTWHLQVR